MSKTTEKLLMRLGECTTFFVVLACILSIAGIAIASDDYSNGVSFVDNGGSVIIPIAVFVQFLVLAGYIGKTVQVLKYLREDADKIQKSVEQVTKHSIKHGERISAHEARLDNLEKK